MRPHKQGNRTLARDALNFVSFISLRFFKDMSRMPQTKLVDNIIVRQITRIVSLSL